MACWEESEGWMILDETWQKNMIAASLLLLLYTFSCMCQTFSFVIRVTFWKQAPLYIYVLYIHISLFPLHPQIYVSPTLVTKKSLLQPRKDCFERRSSTPLSRVARHVWEILTSQKPAMKRRNVATWGEGKWGLPGWIYFLVGRDGFESRILIGNHIYIYIYMA